MEVPVGLEAFRPVVESNCILQEEGWGATVDERSVRRSNPNPFRLDTADEPAGKWRSLILGDTFMFDRGHTCDSKETKACECLK